MFFNGLTWKNYLIGGIALISLYYILRVRYIRRAEAAHFDDEPGPAASNKLHPQSSRHTTRHAVHQKAPFRGNTRRGPPARGLRGALAFRPAQDPGAAPRQGIGHLLVATGLRFNSSPFKITTMQKQITPQFGVLQPSRGSLDRFGKLSRPRLSPHRLRIEFSQALWRALSLREELPQGVSCKLVQPDVDHTRAEPARRHMENFEGGIQRIQLDLADAHLPMDARPGHSTSLPPLIMLFPGNTLLLPFPLHSLENGVAKIKLRQIFHWLGQQRDLASDHYSELWRIKGFALFYAKVKEMALKEMRLIKEYRNGWDKLHAYRIFSFHEQSDLELNYAQILMAGICTMDRLLELTSSFHPPVTPQVRIPALGDTAEELESLYHNLVGINEELAGVSRLRLKSARNGPAS